MRGSILVTFNENQTLRAIDRFEVKVIGQNRYVHSSSSNNLYSTFLESGNEVVFDLIHDTNTDVQFLIFRRDYTTDDENGDRGIKITSITPTTSGTTTSTTYIFTATTRYDAYDFDYIISGETSEKCISIGTGFNQIVNDLEFQSDGKILVGGQFTSYSGVTRNNLVRLNNTGIIDNTFNIGSGFSYLGFAATVHDVKVQSDGKILVGGDFTTYSGVTRNNIIRLTELGYVDNTFSIGTGFNALVHVINTQSDGKILVGGGFTSYSGSSQNRLIRLNTDGTKDTSFSIGTGFNGDVHSIEVQSDGKILIGGGFTTFTGSTQNRIIRLNTEGTKDTSFNVGIGFSGGSVFSIKVQSDGKILMGGGFTSYNGTTSNKLIRLNSDGSIDTSFDIGSGFSGVTGVTSVENIQIQSDGKILIGGNFTSYNGLTANSIIKLNSDGSIDNTFTIGTGFNNYVKDIRTTTTDNIILVGDFTSYNGLTANRIIKLKSDGTENNCP